MHCSWLLARSQLLLLLLLLIGLFAAAASADQSDVRASDDHVVSRIGRHKRYLDTLGGAQLPLIKRQLDSLGGGELPLFKRRTHSTDDADLLWYDPLGPRPNYLRGRPPTNSGYDQHTSDERADELDVAEKRYLDSLGGAELPLF